jgi:hypothetical protein
MEDCIGQHFFSICISVGEIESTLHLITRVTQTGFSCVLRIVNRAQ